ASGGPRRGWCFGSPAWTSPEPPHLVVSLSTCPVGAVPSAVTTTGCPPAVDHDQRFPLPLGATGAWMIHCSRPSALLMRLASAARYRSKDGSDFGSCIVTRSTVMMWSTPPRLMYTTVRVQSVRKAGGGL